MKPATQHGIQTPRLPKNLNVETITTLADRAEYFSAFISGGVLVKQTAASVILEQVLLRRMNFTHLSHTVFQRCDLTHADLRGSKLIGADFRGSIINGMQVGAPELRGAIIEPAQAVQVVSLLRLIVKEQDA